MKGSVAGLLPLFLLLSGALHAAKVAPYEVGYGGSDDVNILTSDDLGGGYSVGTPPDPWEIMRKIVAEELSKLTPALSEQLDQKLAILSRDIKLELQGLRTMLETQSKRDTTISPAVISPEVAMAELNIMTDGLKQYITEEMGKLRSEFETSFLELGVSMKGIAQQQAERMEKMLEKRAQEVTDSLRRVFLFTRNQVTILQEQMANLTQQLGVPDEGSGDEDTLTTLKSLLKDLLKSETDDTKGKDPVVVGADALSSSMTLPPGLIQNLVTETTTAAFEDPPRDCMEVLERGNKASGVYTIQIGGLPPQEVFCDQETEGGGWTVMVSRKPSPEDHLSFRQSWYTYEEGFGNAKEEYWIGLRALHALTNNVSHELRADMRWKDEKAFSHYNKFSVGGRDSNYRLNIDEFDSASTGGDSMSYHNYMEFSTYDEDNDAASGGSCSAWSGGGGWWFNYCYYSNPTGIYPPEDLEPDAKVDHLLEWRKWQGYYTYLDELFIKIRPN